MKRKITLNEAQLHKVIKETVGKVLKEAKVTPNKINSNYYDENEVNGEGFEVGDFVETGNAYHPYMKNISYKGKYAGSALQGNKNFGRDWVFSAPDVEYGNKDGWGQMKYFNRADEYESYISNNWDAICKLLDSGVDFD